jgi:hypothetical protein
MNRVHIIISLDSCLSKAALSSLLRQHSTLFIDMYVDTYKPFKTETISSIARYYLALQIEEHRAKQLNKKYHSNSNQNNNNTNNNDLNRSIDNAAMSDDVVAGVPIDITSYDDSFSLTIREMHSFSTIMSQLHTIAYNEYSILYNIKNMNGNKRESMMPKPFSVSMFKQLALYFHIYMKRIKERETIRSKKIKRAMNKVVTVNDKLNNNHLERDDILYKIEKLKEDVADFDRDLEKQKLVYLEKVEDCRKEQLLIDEMTKALDKLKNLTTSESESNINPQYEMAKKALETLDMDAFEELKSYRAPPQRVLAVVNTLCLMFREPPGWESGKQLLLRENFFEELLYYDKRNIPDDIFSALEQICSVPTFRPEFVKPGSLAAASFCDWILSIYQFSASERRICGQARELKDFQELYNERLTTLGEKRRKAEVASSDLNSMNDKRKSILSKIKGCYNDLKKLKQDGEFAAQLKVLLENDYKNWSADYDNALNLLKTYKSDALMTASCICYCGIFDMKMRSQLIKKWQACFNKPNMLQIKKNEGKFKVKF